ncbi:division plane positioning ATPase MipZ [Pacificimonas flava]|uniref:ATPase n=1 Tax=Pacificimonas flava TaxID=1234595 RepID=M2TLH0_9SPHN|nr:division plane positioning ATPase MipZ [Pacificimonas flava]EMD82526.1 ATPase [Pacificimonas flava]MBB5281356.1 chromosome partitioning protein [Pacificimonas flava]
MAHIITFGNEKGGTGKSTTAVHVAVSLLAAGRTVAAIDLDARQRTFARYMENRQGFSGERGLGLPLPRMTVIAESETAETELASALGTDADFVVIDTPGRDSPLARAALSRADTLVTPINDSFVDFDLIGQVDAETFEVKRPSFYAELVWQSRKARARHDAGSIDWVIVRNRLAQLNAKNMQRVAAALEQLGPRVGFRVAPGLSERVIYRELFPQGLTLLDMDAIDDTRLSHVAARAELRELVEALDLDRPATAKRAVAG